MSRSTAEWIAKHDDQAIPPRVRARKFLAVDGVCTHCCRKIRPGDKWQLDHKVALINGGEHRESNLQLLCDWCHAKKTRRDVAEKAVTARKRQANLGIRKTRRPMPGSKASGWRKRMDGTVERRQ